MIWHPNRDLKAIGVSVMTDQWCSARVAARTSLSVQTRDPTYLLLLQKLPAKTDKPSYL
jgi:hypothetical protein